jgi:hydroxymethylpyrimidine/phosphomethylpyrimidine kinase
MDESKNAIPDYLLEMHESLLLAQLRAIRQLRPVKLKAFKTGERKDMSNMDMVIDILRRAGRPLHVSDIISQVKAVYGADLSRESIVSALHKKLNRLPGLSRTGPNTFAISAK